jgi:ABC-2 type transport system ATP-binding protein
MPEGQVLEFSGITKRFGAVAAVSDFSARVEPGRVTGFLGPNGAGKTTTLRVLLGLVRSTAGTATIGGRPYASLTHPLQTVGAVLEASSFHPGRSAANHLKVYAQAAGLPLRRVDETLDLVGLADAGGRKVGGFSLGMRQRLGLAYALLGDPGVLVLDEPANGLDPEGIKWMRGFLRQLAREGRTVFVSSHLLAEAQQTVDSVLIIAQGRLVYEGTLEGLADPSEYATVVDSPDRAGLAAALTAADVPFDLLRSGLTVRGLDPAAVGAIAASAGVALSALQRRGPALEEVFLDLVSGARVYTPRDAVDGEPAAGVAVAAAVEPVDPGTDADADAPARTEPESDAAGTPEAALAVAGPADLGAEHAEDDERDAEPPVEPAIDPTPTAAFAVASTGVIDIIPFGGDPETDALEDGRPLDADGDVEALGAIDDELSEADGADTGALAADGADSADADGVEGPDDAPNSSDRPWETYVRTEADEEADAFFAAFTGGDDADEPAADQPDADAPDTEQTADALDTEQTDGERSDGEHTPRDDEGGDRR